MTEHTANMDITKKNQKYYFNILALDRSRSTISDIVISQKAGAISLGEVARVISPMGNEKLYLKRDVKCTCGAKVKECEFWREIFYKADHVNTYFKTYLNASYSLCDSSKTIRHSKIVRSYISDNELMGVLVLRDFNEWSSSVKRALKTKSEGQFRQIFKDRKFWKSSIRLSMRRFYVFRVVDYTLTNLRLARELSNYSNRVIIDKSRDFDMFDSFSKNSKDTLTSKKHIIRGNRIMAAEKNMDFWELNHPLSRFLAWMIKFALKVQ